MPLPPGLTLGVTAQGPVPILSLPYNGHYPGPYTHMSEHSDSSESVNSPQQDRTYSYQMGEKLARQLPTRTFSRVPDIYTRSGRAKTPVTHIDDDVRITFASFKIILQSTGLILYKPSLEKFNDFI